MCRLAAFPPGYSKEGAMKIMSSYGLGNRDGVGLAYAKDGHLVIKKWPTAWDTLEKQKVDVFAHMPCSSWTIAHVRAATHGEKTVANTHPFVRGDWAVVHNGIYSGHSLARALLLEMGSTFEGQTDSEVGAELINRFGPKRFLRFATSHDGTWLALNKNGELYAVVAGGACDLFKVSKRKMLVASSLVNKEARSVDEGWIRFSASGKIRGGQYKMRKPYEYSSSSYSPVTTPYPYGGSCGSEFGGHGAWRGPRDQFRGKGSESGRRQAAWEKEWEAKWGKKVTRLGTTEYAQLARENPTLQDLGLQDRHWSED